MWISPKHIGSNTTEWSFDQVIDIFYDRVDGWHLEIADRCINGWTEKGSNCINATDSLGRKVDYIPDSGWAVLQMVFNYFETIALFKLGSEARHWHNRKLFVWGVKDVFDELKSYPDSLISKILYGQFRTSIYHYIGSSSVVLSRSIGKPIEYDASIDKIIIDPHLFVQRLREHFSEYYNQVKKPEEKSLREKFRVAYEFRYGS